ncbi:Sugar lactone lactonase YvrE [Paenibacillus sp. UNCCL117]|uniref:SMP-30/gluconolactonase/LRE family protein n=1 Tax=unclassified Paenibacillus TaxID=185978 RepID=UPI0008832699|nr:MULTISPECIES: SMP-30/gluconolactonase/LRE family protein [unclassified Paenibacillus]SDD62907.1 Sugar lactone lactonase YvrE [Paenibacillus sp. cl123]SFW67709.1 Sugar lactone lactonase YvrE [Paenibacillus sp. UNCCL117]
MVNRLELLAAGRATLGEGPCWDADNQVLYWVDVTAKKLFTYQPATGVHQKAEFDRMIGAVVPRSRGGLMLVMQDGFHEFDPESGALTKLRDPEAHLPDNRFNDGKCDALGRLWAGTMSMKGDRAAGTLYCLDTDLSVRAVVTQVGISNGLGWSPDNTLMYYIDSATKGVWAFDFDLSAGTAGNRRTIVTIPEDDGLPDGMTVDREGMIWVAQWGGGKVSRWNPYTGELMETVPVPASLVTSCAFGGEKLDELFITTAREGLDDQTLRGQPHAGGLFRLKTRVTGLPAHRFGG